MSNKRVRVASGVGEVFHTLPGASGEKRTEKSSVTDTVFGQQFESNLQTVQNMLVTGAAYFKGIAGYRAILYKGGIPTFMGDEATTQIGGSQSYQITDQARRLIDFQAAMVVDVNGVNSTAQVVEIDYLAGIITFAADFDVVGPVTITSTFIPKVVLARARSFTLTQTSAEIDNSTYEKLLANNGWMTYEQGLRTVQFEASRIYDANDDIIQPLQDSDIVYLEGDLNGDGQDVFRGIFQYSGQNQQGNVGALEEESITLQLFVPEGDLLQHPFSWYFGNDSRLNPGIRASIEEWQNGDAALQVQYLPKGTTGAGSGETSITAIVTEATLTNSIEGQNEFRFNYRAVDAPTIP